jgi:hypothetical protein
VNHEDLAADCVHEIGRLDRLIERARFVPGIRARQAQAQLEVSRRAIEQARGFLLATTSGFLAAVVDPRMEPDDE